MFDIAAGVEGIEAAFSAVKPSLVESSPELAAEIRAQLNWLYPVVGKYGFLLVSRNSRAIRSQASASWFMTSYPAPKDMDSPSPSMCFPSSSLRPELNSLSPELL